MSIRWDCPRDGPEGVDPHLADDVDALLTPSPFAWAVVWGRRATAVQAVLWTKYLAGGPEAAPPGQSAHEAHVLPDGTVVPPQAVDVALIDPHSGLETYRYTSDAGWPWLWRVVLMHPRLHSGHDFPKPDDDHIQTVAWWKVEAALKAAGLWKPA